MRLTQATINLFSIILLFIFFFSAFFPPETYLFSKMIVSALVILLGFQVASGFRREDRHCLTSLIILSFLLINLALSFSPYRAATTLCYYLQLGILFLVFLRLVSFRQLHFLMKCLVIIATLLSLYGLYQRLFGFDFLTTFLKESSIIGAESYLHKIQSGRVFSTFVLPSSFAGFLLLSSPLTVFFIKTTRRKGWKIFCSLCFLIQASAFLLTLSLGALFSLFLSFLIMTSLVISKRKLAGLLAMIFLFLMIVTMFLHYRDIDPSQLFAGQNPLILRVGNWKAAWLMFRDHPFFGVGNGSFGIAFSQYREAWMNETNYAHNTYLQVLAENGLLSIPFLLAFFLTFFKRLFARFKSIALLPKELLEEKHLLFPFLAFSCLSWIIHNLMDFTFYHASVSVLFISLLGAFFSGNDFLYRQKIPGVTEKDERKGEENSHRILPGLYKIIVVCILSLVFLFFLQSYLSDSSYYRGVRFASMKEWHKAHSAIQRAERINPFKSEYKIFKAQLLMEEDSSTYDLARAEGEAEKAISMDSHIPYYHDVLSDIQVLKGEPLMAYRSISLASELYPIQEKYRQKKKIMEKAMNGWIVQEEESGEKGKS